MEILNLRAKVLIVNGKESDLLARDSQPSERKFDVLRAENAEAAINVAKAQDLALIVLDMDGSMINALNVAKSFKSDPKTSALPIIIVVAQERNLKHELVASAQGIIDIIYKPIEPLILELTIKGFVDIYLANQTKSMMLSEFDKEPVAITKSARLDGLQVLVVDDSPDNLFLVDRLLTKNGAKVVTANDGDEGVKKALSGTYDVVLMDIQMPKLDGYQAKLALDKNGYKKPIIALTAHAMSDERIKTKNAGFAAHLTKPLNGTELVNEMVSICRS